MDTLIRKQLCKHCGAIVDAAEELEKARVMRKAARDKLLALGIGERKAKEDDEDEDDMDRAMQETRAAMGIPEPRNRKTAVTKRHAGGAPPGPANPLWINIPERHMKRLFRGEVSPLQLSKELKIGKSAIMRRVRDRIGPAAGTRWQPGLGYKRNGVQVKYVPPSSEKQLALEAPRKGRKPGSKNGTYTDADLQAVINGQLTHAQLAQRTGLAVQSIYTALGRFKARYGADNVKTVRSPTAPRARGRIEDVDLARLANGHKTIAQIAHKYRLAESLVRAQLKEWKARKGDTGGAEPASRVVSSTSNGTTAAPVIPPVLEALQRVVE